MTDQWRTTTITTKTVKFYDGNSINKTSSKSYYGLFNEAIKDVYNKHDPNIHNKYKIPQVIVIGSESCGKSSILENLTKCPVFPRDSKICTKQPIRLRLIKAESLNKVYYAVEYDDNVTFVTQTKTKIVKKVLSIMDELPKDSVSDKEIIITICDVGLSNFEFIDLPGIRAYPESLAIKTREINEKYISQDNTIILCIAQATTTRLTSYEPIALLNKYSKIENTILVLTMCDRVGDDNIDDLIVKRVCLISDELENLPFAKCTAVINRKNNGKSLVKNNKDEENWFNENIKYHTCDDFNHRQTLFENLGTSVLIKNIDDIYSQYVKETWIPQTVLAMEKEIDDLKNNVENLGPELLSNQLVDLDLVKNIVSEQLDISYTFSNETYNDFQDDIGGKVLLDCTDCIDRYETILDEKVKCIAESFFDNFSKLIRDPFEKQYVNKEYQDKIKFMRFVESILQNINSVLPDLKTEFLKFCKKSIPRFVANTFIARHVFIFWHTNFKNHVSKIKFDKIFEDDFNSSVRDKLTDQIYNLETSIEQIKKLETLEDNTCKVEKFYWSEDDN